MRPRIQYSKSTRLALDKVNKAFSRSKLNRAIQRFKKVFWRLLSSQFNFNFFLVIIHYIEKRISVRQLRIGMQVSSTNDVIRENPANRNRNVTQTNLVSLLRNSRESSCKRSRCSVPRFSRGFTTRSHYKAQF